MWRKSFFSDNRDFTPWKSVDALKFLNLVATKYFSKTVEEKNAYFSSYLQLL